METPRTIGERRAEIKSYLRQVLNTPVEGNALVNDAGEGFLLLADRLVDITTEGLDAAEVNYWQELYLIQTIAGLLGTIRGLQISILPPDEQKKAKEHIAKVGDAVKRELDEVVTAAAAPVKIETIPAGARRLHPIDPKDLN